MMTVEKLFVISKRCKECKLEIQSESYLAYIDRHRLKCFKEFADILIKDSTGDKLLNVIENIGEKYRLQNAIKNAEEQKN